MYTDLIKTDNQTNVAVTLFVQIPQGDRFEVKIEQGQCSFYLNDKIVEQIQQVKKTDTSLDIPPKLIVYLWYFICFNKNIRLKYKKQIYLNFDIILILDILKAFLNKTPQNQTRLESGITFNCYYKQAQLASDAYEDKDIVLQTTIIYHGDIFHKIRWDFLENSQYSIIVSVHSWLAEKLISRLQINPNLLVWEIASSFNAGFLVYNLYLPNQILSIFVWLGLSILFSISRYVLLNQFQRRTTINSKSVNWLAWGIVCLIPSLVVGGTNEFNDVNAFLLPFSSVMAPKLVEYILSFIQPRISKLILHRLLSS
ncbi:hypothetical protein [Nostoc sp. C117]|uniref:hypothetical protein n=1 Tax=Nostoc sp. C117 TaxID=3349875 RepID=UPI00370D45AB